MSYDIFFKISHSPVFPNVDKISLHSAYMENAVRERGNFTSGRIARFQCEPRKQQSIFWDAKTPGLGLRVTRTGAKAYVFETKLHGRTLRLTIGDTRTWTVRAAQAEATRLKAKTDQGIDPRQEKKAKAEKAEADRQAEQQKAVTLGEAWARYIDERRSKWGELHLRNHLRMAQAGGVKRKRGRRKGQPATTVQGPLYPLLHRRLTDVDAKAVANWLRPLAKRAPTTANQTHRALAAFIRWCGDYPAYGIAVHADACNSRIAKDILPKAKPKTDALQREQLKSWFQEVRKIDNPVIAAYLQALLLTGARREEMAHLRWQDVDFKWLSLTIRDKVDGQRTIPLTPYLSNTLANLPRRNEWVFSSPAAASGRLQEPRINHTRALEAAGLPAVSLHGLRRSFASLTEWVECPAGVVAQIMGHKPSATAEKHYKVRPLDLLRMWHTKIEAWMLEQAGIEFTEEKPGLRVVGTG